MSDQNPPANPLFSNFVPPNEQTIPFTTAPNTPPKRPRKPRAVKAAPEPKAPKTKRKPRPPKQPVAPEQVARPGLQLHAILRACAELKDEDFTAFDMLFNMVKPQRERILAAIGKVFA